MSAPTWRQQRKLVALDERLVTPELVLARTLEKARAGHVAAVAIAITWTDGSADTDWSPMTAKNLGHLAALLRIEADEIIKDARTPATEPATPPEEA